MKKKEKKEEKRKGKKAKCYWKHVCLYCRTHLPGRRKLQFCIKSLKVSFTIVGLWMDATSDLHVY